VYEKPMLIRWRDLDALGHVNNAVYLTYLEELLNEWLEPVLAADWVTARVELDFRRELRGFGGTVVARAWIDRVGTSSVTARVEIVAADGEVAAEGRTVVVAWDAQAGRSRPLTDGQRSALESL
jgi:acyl-CoA thioester hydrolase